MAAPKPSVLAPPPATKNHGCMHCGKQFRNNSERLAHERVHTGEKPFACTYCDKKFGQKGQAARHERVHTGGQPHACGTCGKRFPSTSNLKIHIRVHTGEKPFGCSFCDKKFVQRSVRLQVRREPDPTVLGPDRPASPCYFDPPARGLDGMRCVCAVGGADVWDGARSLSPEDAFHRSSPVPGSDWVSVVGVSVDGVSVVFAGCE